MTDTSSTPPIVFAAYSLAGPVSLSLGGGTTFTVTPTASATGAGSLTVTPSCTLAGSFDPAVLTFPAGATGSASFSFTPTVSGSGTISTANNENLTDPTPLDIVVTGSPAYALTGPSSLLTGSKTTYSLTPTAGTVLSAALTVTPHSSLDGVFAPTSIVLPAGSSATASFTFIPAISGSGTLSTTNSGGQIDPAALSITVSTQTTTFSTYSLTGPTSLVVGKSSTYTVTPGSGSALSQAATITPTCSLAGTFSPASVDIPAGSTAAQQFTFTPSASGVGTLGTGNTAGLSDPGTLFLTVSATEKAFTEYSVSGSQSLIVGDATTYTITPGDGAGNTQPITIVPTVSLGGTLTPPTCTFPAGSTSPKTFVFTPSVAGTGLFSFSNNGALTDPASFPVTAFTETSPYLLTVDSSAFLFSPGNWTGDAGRGGSLWRNTWNVGAWFQVSWLASASPLATLHLGPENTGAYLSYFLNGVATRNISAAGNLTLSNIIPGHVNRLEVFLTHTPTNSRWQTGQNSLTVSGMTVDPASTAGQITRGRQWGKIIGDDTAEGIMADDGTDNVLCSFSYYLLRAMSAAGYLTGVSACANSGFITPGDTTQDVPAFYSVSGSTDGTGGVYDDSKSRWNMLDAGVSALDANGQLSAYGESNTPPSWIAFNLMAQDALSYASQSDAQSAMTQCLLAHRTAAPHAWLFAIMPFGFHYAATYSPTWPQLFNNAIAAYRTARPDDDRLVTVDPGSDTSLLLEANAGWYSSANGHQLLAEGQAILATTISGLMLGGMTTTSARAYLYY